eukprot:gene2772-biopygen4410
MPRARSPAVRLAHAPMPTHAGTTADPVRPAIRGGRGPHRACCIMSDLTRTAALALIQGAPRGHLALLSRRPAAAQLPVGEVGEAPVEEDDVPGPHADDAGGGRPRARLLHLAPVGQGAARRVVGGGVPDGQEPLREVRQHSGKRVCAVHVQMLSVVDVQLPSVPRVKRARALDPHLARSRRLLFGRQVGPRLQHSRIGGAAEQRPHRCRDLSHEAGDTQRLQGGRAKDFCYAHGGWWSWIAAGLLRMEVQGTKFVGGFASGARWQHNAGSGESGAAFSGCGMCNNTPEGIRIHPWTHGAREHFVAPMGAEGNTMGTQG